MLRALHSNLFLSAISTILFAVLFLIDDLREGEWNWWYFTGLVVSTVIMLKSWWDQRNAYINRIWNLGQEYGDASAEKIARLPLKLQLEIGCSFIILNTYGLANVINPDYVDYDGNITEYIDTTRNNLAKLKVQLSQFNQSEMLRELTEVFNSMVENYKNDDARALNKRLDEILMKVIDLFKLIGKRI